MSYPAYSEYKETGLDWLGKVPAEWDVKPFWTLYSRVKRTGHEGAQLLSVYRDYGVIPKSSRDDNNNKESEDLSGYQLVKQRDLAMNKMKAWQGSLGVSSYHGIVSPAYFVFEANHQQCDRYLHHLMRSPRFITGYLSLSKGIRVNQWDLDPQYHSRMPILLPSIQEQTQIANFLDRETAKIDTLIEKQQRLIKLLQEKRQAVISHAVTKGLNPNVKMKDSGVEWLGEVPEHWVVSKFGYVSMVVRGGSPRPAGDPTLFNGDYSPWVTVAEITKDDELYLDSTETYLTKLGSEQCRVFKNGTLLLSNSGATLGVPKILGIDANANDGVVGFEHLSPKLDIEFAYFYLASLTDNLRERINQGSGQPNLNTDLVKDIPLPLPTDDEQKEIVHHVKAAIAKFDSIKTSSEEMMALLQERRTALISAAVTGKIDVRKLVK